LFVYGSLKRAGQHHAELKGALFLGEACTVPGFALENVGQYLALVPAFGSSGRVDGELFAVNPELISALDEFEGDAYFRGEIALAKPVVMRTPEADSEKFEVALAYFKKAR
jgi:gamma-glutamylcyclotransferase (GGCT)/AIG2-like uncharacterized protein YtfP